MATILIVEDNPANLALMVYLLEAFGHTARTATNGAEGVAAALAERPDLVLMDLQMPNVDGYHAAEQMRAAPELAGVPVVAVTASAMVGDRDAILARGFDGYIAKPILPEAFLQQIERFLPSKE